MAVPVIVALPFLVYLRLRMPAVVALAVVLWKAFRCHIVDSWQDLSNRALGRH